MNHGLLSCCDHSLQLEATLIKFELIAFERQATRQKYN